MAQFRSWTGDFKKEQRVSLVGRSRAEETRAQVLERTRKEREQRRQEKLQLRSATTIQAAWRGLQARQRHQAEVRRQWLACYGNQADTASSVHLAPDSGFLRGLCYFADITEAQDVQLLAAACRLVLASQQAAGAVAGTGPAAGAGGQAPQLLLCMHAAASKQQAESSLYQCQQLVALCLAALSRHAEELGGQLRQPRLGAAAAASSAIPVPPMVEVALLLTAPNSWEAALGQAAAAASAQILEFAIRHGLFAQLAAIAAAVCPEVQAAASGASAQRKAVPCGEALLTALTVRILGQQAVVTQRQQQQQRRQQHVSKVQGVQLLLCQPMLLQRLPTLAPAATRLWRQTVATLHALPASALSTWLHDSHGFDASNVGAAAGAAAALLGNLLEGAAAALKADDGQQLAAARQPALQFVSLASTLLALLPCEPFFPSSTRWAGADASKWADDDEDEGGEGQALLVAATAATKAARLPWDPAQQASQGVVAQLQLVSSGSLLRALVRAVLPHSSAAAGSSQQSGQLRQTAADVRQLCSLLQQLMALPGQRQRVLVMLAFSADLVQRLWFSYLRPAQAAPGEGWVPSGDAACDPGWMLPVTLFSLAYSSFIITAGDDELYTAQRPLPLTELYDPQSAGGVLALLKMALWHVLWMEVAPLQGGWAPEAAALRLKLKQAAGKLMGQLHDRCCHHPFAPTEAFQADALPGERFQSEMQAGTAAGRQLTEEGSGRAWGLLSFAPFLVPFRERAKLFQAVVAQERDRYSDMEIMHSFSHQFGSAHRFLPIKRTQVLHDAFEKMSGMGEALHGRIRIQFIDAHGMEEAGVDGGGLFKEFLEMVVREGFDPNLGLFKATTDNRLYPNPQAQLTVDNALRLIEFLGRVVGKAMYEGILVELPLAPFFLKKFRGAYCDINDLPTLDPELHRNLFFLKRYEGDVADLGLSFTITDIVLGVAQEVELAPNGHDVAVTGDNRLAYIHRVADYRLNKQIREATAAFLKGLHELIKPEWVRMFNEEELQMLISGGQQGLDIDDMRTHVQYSGGYHEEHPVIQEFWRALATFTPKEQADFLRFVTSCARPPLLGFQYLSPPLAIQLAGSMLDERAPDRLPTAATCMNLLKLPPYRSAQQIRDKLLYAVESGAGFELS
ncbi:hypothetical protein D9Q98_008876 [Chlorella vulgaris]|uniref:HECT-type E3 ubiquitin transferase n=1 Tax=Chlorella vulgaris TaxID=3077 RepID=A0A9D4YUJ0_CHLVU|nr:hypothetical protein D9Q98_008876 [Chlorella vulgaris]